MFDFFKPKVKAIKFSKEEILPKYYKMRTWNLSGVFIGYMGYYLVRNNISLFQLHLYKINLISVNQTSEQSQAQCL